DQGITFNYDLPEDQFRQPYMVRRVKVTFEAKDVPALGYKTFALVNKKDKIEKSEQQRTSLVVSNKEMDNDYMHVAIEENGSLTITDKQTNRTYEQIGVYENTGDIGNEYMYKQHQNDKALKTENITARIELAEDTPFRAAFDIVQDRKSTRLNSSHVSIS